MPELLFLVVIIMIIAVFAIRAAKETDLESNIKEWGALKENFICPHCQTKGNVHVKEIKTKKGISGGKATVAILTGGVSLLATGLARKEAGIQAYCTNCDVAWII